MTKDVTTTKDKYHCYKCYLQHDEHEMICGRCGNDLTIITLSEELTTEDHHKQVAGKKELQDLKLILRNWAGAFKTLIDEKGVDWSVPHEFLEEYGTCMLPYVSRLLQTGYVGRECVIDLAAEFQEQIKGLILRLEQEEAVLRLTGQWTGDEQENKEYWEERFSKAHGCSIESLLSLPMRNE